MNLRIIGKVTSFVLAMSICFAVYGQPKTSQEDRGLALSIFKELVEINTTHSVGDTTRASEAMAKRLVDAGFPDEDVKVLVPHPKKGNLVARYRGTGARKPLLLLAHLDVVEARREDWTLDPFTLIEKDGYYYGRGTLDDKAMAAIWISSFIRLKRDGFVPDRDIIVCLTADEEGGDHNGVEWLLANRRELVDGAYCLNEGGNGLIKDGKYLLNGVQLSEKVYLSFTLEVTNPGGHSSVPSKDNAIYRLAAGLTRLAAFDFPVQLNEGTRTYFERMSALQTGQTARDMLAVAKNPPDVEAGMRLSKNDYYNALLRTTCVATKVEAGHAENALPQSAKAVVNCRILPGESADEVFKTIVRVLDDAQISVTPMGEPTPSPPSPLNPEVIDPIERLTEEFWPGVPVVPTMLTGATDGLQFRNAGIPVYGVSGLFRDIDDNRIHGRDERIGVKAFYEGNEFLFRLIQELSS